MTGFTRYAVYVVPQGAFHDHGAEWLGWDSIAGRERPHARVPDLPLPIEEITRTPRKYGFHGTIKPPFRLAPGRTEADLRAAFADRCAGGAPVTVGALAVGRLGGFIAVRPEDAAPGLTDLAARMVEDMDGFRAPPTRAELARRRAAGLSPRQEALLTRWGYPHVMEEFRFHMTLTGRLPEAVAPILAARLEAHFAPVLPRPFVIADLALLGEAGDGRFHVIDRAPLSG